MADRSLLLRHGSNTADGSIRPAAARGIFTCGRRWYHIPVAMAHRAAAGDRTFAVLINMLLGGFFYWFSEMDLLVMIVRSNVSEWVGISRWCSNELRDEKRDWCRRC